MPRLRSRYDCFDKLIAGFESSMPDTESRTQRPTDFIPQMLSIFTDSAASCHTLGRSDTKAMAELACRFGGQSIIPLVKANLHQSGLVVDFLGKLYQTLECQPKESQSVLQTQKAFRTVLEIFIPRFEPPDDRPISKRRRTNDQGLDEVSKPAFLADKVKAGELTALISYCENLTLDPEIESLLRTIRKKCATGTVGTSVYESFLVPMLTSLLSILPRQHVDINAARYKKLYQTVCSAFIQRYVGLAPQRPINWTRGPQGCGLSGTQCDDCASLDKFLIHPTEDVISITTNLQRRTHIEKQFQDQRKKRFLKISTKMTDPSMSQFMLEITKTDEEWRHDLSQWKARRATAKRHIEAIGSFKDLQPLLSNENGLVPELRDLGLFEASQKFVEVVSKLSASGNKRRRGNEDFNKIHLLD